MCLLTDRLLANWTNIWLLQERGVELVSRLNKAHRKADFRRGQRLGDDDHIVRWFKPTSIRSLDWQTYKSLPESITIREARIRVAQPGFRTKFIVVVTTLLDPQQTTKEDLATLYRARWNNELDLRSIKSTMQMRHLRCKTPELVHKEIWTHILAYNLIRTIIAQAAIKHDCLPRSLSFKGAKRWKCIAYLNRSGSRRGTIARPRLISRDQQVGTRITNDKVEKINENRGTAWTG